jgi:hypothetical protein
MPIEDHLPALDTPSVWVRRLGYASLVPFVLLSALLWMVRPDVQGFVAIALTSYAAVVASFLGGVHWGIAARLPPSSSHASSQSQAKFHWLWGVAPSLLAWVALVMPAYARLPLMGLVIALCYAVDHYAYPPAGWGAWLPLRLRLTVVAVLSCVVGAATA